MKHYARIIADSLSPYGYRLTTFEVCLPRIVLAELNTHRVFSRNSASSRAIPVEKMIRMVEQHPYVPTHWGKNQRGMQADEELPPTKVKEARDDWWSARIAAVKWAKHLLDIGVHKQVTNRLLEPFMWHTVIITSTEWSNWFHLRNHPMAHPEIQRAAELMQREYEDHKPIKTGEWHLPFVWNIDFDELVERWHTDRLEGSSDDLWFDLAKISSARCARVSYLTHDGRRDGAVDLALFNRLLDPGHMSPFEHAARPMDDVEFNIFKQQKVIWNAEEKCWKWVGVSGTKDGEYTHFCGNIQGWIQLRKLIPGEEDILGYRNRY